MYSREALPSRVLILDQVMDALKDPNLNMIGVYGMGGVGKTTLAKEVLTLAAGQKLFETAVLVVVSQMPELRRIQGEIADALGLKLEAEGVPERASQLNNRLKEAKVLIILDDVWQKLDLNAVGIPYGHACEGCKTLLTSRRKDVLSYEMCTQKDFLLDLLEEEESWRLFEMYASEAKDPDLRAIATEVAKRCAGLPLLILKVATDLQNKDSYTWSDMLNQLSSMENTESYQKVHKVIESTYEKLLDEEAKSLFLLCSLFGNPNIRILDLLFYYIATFEHFGSIERARDIVLTLIHELKNKCLLLDGDRVGFVKMHDVVRDSALAISFRVQHAFVGISNVRSTDLQNKDCTRISLSYCDILELPEVLECPEAEMFSLFVENISLDIANSFFEVVTKLKVVDFNGVHFVSGLPSSLGFLTSLQTLCLHRCQFDNVAVVSELRQLELLSFADSNIAELPREIKALTRLKLLDLRNCTNLQSIPKNVLSKLLSLEELYMINSFVGWDHKGNVSLVELKYLSYLTTLEIQIVNPKLIPKVFKCFNRLKKYKISIGDEWDWDGKYETSTALKVKLGEGIHLVDGIQLLLRRTENLYLDEMGEIGSRYDLDGEGFPLLKHLHIHNDSCYAFPILESLYLNDLNCLESLSFGKLQSLNISNCDKLKNLSSFSSTKCLTQLQELEVESCRKMESMVGAGIEAMEFTQLGTLKLRNLPHLKGFSNRKEGTGQKESVSFPNLTNLVVENCKSLKYVFTASMVECVQQLKKLEINHCESLEEIILSKETGEVEDIITKIVFPKLDYLSLKELAKLKRFSCGYRIEFLLLRELSVEECHAMENFAQRNISYEGDQYIFNEMVTFSNLETITLRNMDNIAYLWQELSTAGEYYIGDLFFKLKSLSIAYLSSLKYVFSESMVRSLLKLEQLEIRNCNVEVIIAKAAEDGKSAEGTPCFEFPQLAVFQLENLNKLRGMYAGPHTLVWPKLIRLEVCDCDKMMMLGSIHDVPLQSEEKMEVYSCDSMEDVRHHDEEVIEFSQLCCLKLNNPSHLTGFCNKIGRRFGMQVSFPNLTTLELYECKSLKYVFTYSLAKCVMQLENLVIKNCELVEEIILTQKFEETEESIDKIVLPKMDYLSLEDLPDLKRFGSGFAFEFPSLRQLSISYCPALKNFVSRFSGNDCDEHYYLFNEMVNFSNLEKLELSHMKNCRYLWHQQFRANDSFLKLKSLRIEYCSKLVVVFPSNVYGKFQRLEKLYLSCCSRVEEIYQGSEFEEMSTIEGFSLRDLEIWNLPSLKYIWSKDSLGAFTFEYLQSAKVSSCKDLKYVFPECIACGLPQLQHLKIVSCDVEVVIAKEKDEESKTAPRFEFPQLTVLRLENLNELRNLYDGAYTLVCPKLKCFGLQGCDQVMKLGSEMKCLQVCGFDELTKFGGKMSAYHNRKPLSAVKKFIGNSEELALDHQFLKAILSAEFGVKFSKLKKVTLSSLEEESIPLLFRFLGRYSLETLAIVDTSVEEIFFLGDENGVLRHKKYHLRVKHLEVAGHDNLKCIIKKDSQLNLIFSYLETLNVEFCPDLMNIAPSSAIFKNLTILNVSVCFKMMNLVTASTANTMKHLMELRVSECYMMENVVENDGEEYVINFQKLKHLEFNDLPTLNSFCAGNYAFYFPSLEQVVVKKCSLMKMFCGGRLVTPKLHGVLFEDEQHWEGNLNDTISSTRRMGLEIETPI